MSRQRHGEDGAALILALAFLALFSLVVAAILSFSDAGLRGTVELRKERSSVYTADAATETAINAIANSSYNAVTGTTCPTQQFPDLNGTGSAVVNCTATPPGSGGSGVPITTLNRPRQAILTLSTTAGENGVAAGAGFFHGTNSGASPGLQIRGDVYSHSGVTANPGSITLDTVNNSRLFAKGACSGTIGPSSNVTCNATTPPPVFPIDPLYDPPAVPTAVQAVPNCGPSSRAVVPFTPGLYVDGSALSALTSGSSPCSKVLWFQPGVYYFDFWDATSTARTWSLTDSGVTVVGGVPSGWSMGAGGALTGSLVLPGSCQGPLTNSAGVTFVFGGDSRLSIAGSKVELCAPSSATQPPIALYGISDAKETAGVTTQETRTAQMALGTPPTNFTPSASAWAEKGPTALVPNDPLSGGTATGDNMRNASPAGAVATAYWTEAALSSAGPVSSASAEVSGFATATAIPAGSYLRSASLNIRYRTINGNDMNAPTVQVQPPGAAGSTSFTLSAANDIATTTFRSARIDVLSLFRSAVRDSSSLATTTAKLSAGLKGGSRSATIQIDAIELELSYTPAGYRSQTRAIADIGSAKTGCVGTAPYNFGSGSGCAFLSTTGGRSVLYIQGLAYSPMAALDVSVPNQSGQAFRWGIITRSLATKIPTGSLTGNLIELPDLSAAGGTLTVVFTTYVCPGLSSCSAETGTRKLQARATYTDPSGAPVAGQRRVAVNAWNVIR